MRNLVIILFTLICLNSSSQVGVGPAPYCMPAYSNTPCNQPNPSNTAGNSVNDFIDSFNTTGGTANITNNNTGCNAQVLGGSTENYFSVGCPNFLRTLPNQVVTCNFRSGIIYDQGFAVYIDWNNNNVFAPAELVCSTPVVLAATWTSAVFTVPGAQANGNYRMRVRCAYFTSGALIDPCLSFGFGETEDYQIVVGAAGTCLVLPIELTSFNALFIEGKSNITWSTATEINSDYFTIERSYDNESFEIVSKIPANGNSTSTKYYTTTDNNVRNGIVYYRLKQYDKMSSVENISKTIVIYANERNIGFDMYPNPANTEMTLVVPDALSRGLSVVIYDSFGNQVLSESVLIKDNKTLNFNISNFLSGTYFVRVTDESGEVMKKVLIKQ